MRTLYKYFVFSDVHGEYNALIKSLEDAGYERGNPSHKLVSLGDNFDRGPDSRKIYSFLTQNHAICVKGNHDVMFQEYLEKGMDGEFVLFNILHNGLGETIKSFSGLQDNQFSVETLQRARNNINGRDSLLRWIKEMPIYYETDTFIFVHAGINPNVPDWRLTDEHYSLWDIGDSHKSCPNVRDKVVIIGHHHAFRVRQNGLEAGYGDPDLGMVELTTNSCDENGHRHRYKLSSYGNTDENRPYISGNKIAIDGCTNLTKKVNVLVIEDYEKEEPKSKPEDKPESRLDGPNVTVSSNGCTINGCTINVEPQWYNYVDMGTAQGIYTTTTNGRW